MAVPSISAVVPGDGITLGGYLIEITGTNFRIPPVPPAGYTGGEAQRTVKVEIDGVECDLVYEATTARVFALIPPYAGDPDDLAKDVDVTVTNLDDDGDPIPGETVTLVDGFKYHYLDLAIEQPVTNVGRKLKHLMERRITKNVYLRTSPDYDDTVADELDRIAEQAGDEPWVAIIGPTLEPNPDYQENEYQEKELAGGEYSNFREAVACDLTYEIAGGASGAMSHQITLNLLNLLVIFMRQTTHVEFEVAGSGVDLETEEREIELTGYPNLVESTNIDGRFRFVSEIKVIGVPVDLRDRFEAIRTAELDEDPDFDFYGE